MKGLAGLAPMGLEKAVPRRYRSQDLLSVPCAFLGVEYQAAHWLLPAQRAGFVLSCLVSLKSLSPVAVAIGQGSGLWALGGLLSRPEEHTHQCLIQVFSSCAHRYSK